MEKKVLQDIVITIITPFIILLVLFIAFNKYIKFSDEKSVMTYFYITLSLYVLSFLILNIGGPMWCKSKQYNKLYSLSRLFWVIIKPLFLVFVFFLPSIFELQKDSSDKFNENTLMIGLLIYGVLVILFSCISEGGGGLLKLINKNGVDGLIDKIPIELQPLLQKMLSLLTTVKPIVILFAICSGLYVLASNHIPVEYKFHTNSSIIAITVISIFLFWMNKSPNEYNNLDESLFVKYLLPLIPGINLNIYKDNKTPNIHNTYRFPPNNSLSSIESIVHILVTIILFFIIFLKDNVFLEKDQLALVLPGIICLLCLWVMGKCIIFSIDSSWPHIIGIVFKLACMLITVALCILFFVLIIRKTWVFEKIICVIKHFVFIIWKLLSMLPATTIIFFVCLVLFLIKFRNLSFVAIPAIIAFFAFMTLPFNIFLFVIIPCLALVAFVYMILKPKLGSKLDNMLNSSGTSIKFNFITNLVKYVFSCFFNPKKLYNSYKELNNNSIGTTTKNIFLIEVLVILIIAVGPIILKALNYHGGTEILKGPKYLKDYTTLPYSSFRKDVSNSLLYDTSEQSNTYDIAKEKNRTFNFALSFWIYINKFSVSKNTSYSANSGYNSDNRNVNMDPNIILNYLDTIILKYNNETSNIEIFYKNHNNKEKRIYQSTDFKFQRWNNIVFNYENGTLDIFINDDLKLSKTNILFSNNRISTKDALTIGQTNAWSNYSDDGLNGGIKNVYYYNSNISRTKIHTIYNL